uniref:F-box domain-containing protein n=1 Tax=Arundo donax TaxID=35708 RepID=A0A0A9CD22_ARUDO
MSDDEGLTTLRRRRPRSPAPASPPEDDELLSEILLPLPPALSSLPHASLVCTRWRRLVSEPGFLRRFRARHRRNPPLLSFFTKAVSECPLPLLWTKPPTAESSAAATALSFSTRSSSRFLRGTLPPSI